MTPTRVVRLRRPRMLPAVTVGAAILLVAVGGTYVANSASGGSSAAALTTATVTRGSVESTLTLTGTVARVQQATAAFPVSGTVTAVSVRVGDQVRAGQALATIDPTPLQQSVLDAQAQLDRARADLASDLTAASAASTTTGTSGTSGSTGNSSTRSTSTGAAPGAGSTGARTTQPGAPVGGSGADQALAAVTAAQRVADQACAPVLGARSTPPGPAATASASVSATTTTSPTSTTATSTTATSTTATTTTATTATSTTTATTATTATTTTSTHGTSTSPAGGPGTSAPAAPTAQQVQACLSALGALADAQRHAGTVLRSWSEQLAAQLSTMNEQITAAVAAALARAGAGSGAGGVGAGGGTGGAASVSESRLITDRAAVTSSEAALAKAQDNLVAATLVAPLDGTVGAIPWSAGDTAGPSGGIQIVGAGASKVTVQVPQASLAAVLPGQLAHVTVAGLPTVDGRVATVSLLPTTSSTSATPTYATDVLVTGLGAGLGTGGRATVSIVVQRVDGVLLVPASAVTAVSTGVGSVGVVSGGATTRVTVQTGASGGGAVEILSGLALGDIVILGDPSQPLPTNGGFPGVGGGLGGIGGIGGNVRVPGAGGGPPGGGPPGQ